MYENELKALQAALEQLEQQVGELRINAIRMPGRGHAKAVAWQIEDAKGHKVFVALSGSLDEIIEDKDGPQAPSDVVFNVEAEIGQLLEVRDQDAKTFLELNYTETNLAKIALTQDQRLMVIHRRWFEDITTKSAIDAIAEVWNLAQNLRESLNPQSPGHA